MNHYDLLGITNTATPEDIKKAYRKLASQHHPDKGGDTAKFQEIQKANEILSDEHKRAQYDMELAGGGRHFQFNTSDMPNGDFDMFDMLRRQFGVNFGNGQDPFSQFKQANQRRQPPRNRDVRIMVPLELEETLSEQTKTLKVTLPGNMQENIEIKIPRGIHNGNTVRYSGLGDHSITNAPRADLYVQFHVKPHSRFGQSGIDLVAGLTINCLDAVVGCEKEVEGIDGKKFKISIPPGTQFGARFGIPDQGLYTTDHPGRGKLVVMLEIYIPKELTEEQLKTIRSIQSTL